MTTDFELFTVCDETSVKKMNKKATFINLFGSFEILRVDFFCDESSVEKTR